MVKLGFILVCKLGGHNLLESIFSFTTPVILGAAIGIETFLRFRDWRNRRSAAASASRVLP